MKKILLVVALVIGLFGLQPAWAADDFVVQNIQVQGLQHIELSTVLHYIPVHIGETFTAEKSNETLTKLYATGFFSNLSLSRLGNTLIVKVAEFPAIDSVTINGNTAIPAKQLDPVQQKSGMNVGQIYNAASLKAFVEGIRQQYLSLGYYQATVDSDVKNLSGNLVAITINVHSAGLTRVEGIRIEGNHAYDEGQLLNEIELSTPNLISFFTDSDRYSEQKLEASIDKLTNFYMDRGYIRFQIVSKEAQLAPDHQGIYVVITISEGKPYTISGYSLPPTLSVDEKAQIDAILYSEKGQLFSRDDLIQRNQRIGAMLGNQGYAFPNVVVTPTIDDQNQTVFLNYTIDNGPKVYVRHENFSGNITTEEIVLRRSVRQIEGELYSKAKIDESKRRLANLPYLQNIQVQPVRVKDTKNLVDLDYSATEHSAGSANITLGYSDMEGFLYGANVSESNLLGTGKYAAVGFTRSVYQQNYYLAYNNPFYTIYGLSRGFNLSFTKTTPGNVDLSTYTQDSVNASINYGMPVSDYDTLTFGYGYEYNYIGVSQEYTPTQMADFIADNGNYFSEGILSGGWVHSTLDQFPLSTSGVNSNVNLNLYAPLNTHSLTYYKATYLGNWYLPINEKHTWILNAHTTLGYGDGLGKTTGLPFFENFYAGGISTVPGYTANTLGPQATSPLNAAGTAMGGHAQVAAGIDFIFPNYISDSLRTALTFNGGNVYAGTISLKGANELRYSAGLMVIWQSPLGALDFSLAKALNPHTGDDLSPFQFSMGTTF